MRCGQPPLRQVELPRQPLVSSPGTSTLLGEAFRAKFWVASWPSAWQREEPEH
jgi:hypothetical protein